MSIYPISYVDAAGWPGVITVRERYDYTSADGKVTTTGSAVFTYARTRLADYVAKPKLPFGTDDFFLGVTPGKAKFVAVQNAIGKMPGWLAFFGPQDPKEDAFTATDSTSPGQPPIVTHFGAQCSLGAYCAPVAPGKRAFVTVTDQPGMYESQQALLSLNGGFTTGASVSNALYAVDLIENGSPADLAQQRPEVPPIYRVTLPRGIGSVSAFNLVVNGATYTPSVYGGSFVPSLASLVETAIVMAIPGEYSLTESLTPWVFDVQMRHYGNTLAAGRISYARLTPLDSTIYFPGSSKVISNPFPMIGQSFSAGPNPQGFSATVQL